MDPVQGIHVLTRRYRDNEGDPLLNPDLNLNAAARRRVTGNTAHVLFKAAGESRMVMTLCKLYYTRGCDGLSKGSSLL